MVNALLVGWCLVGIIGCCIAPIEGKVLGQKHTFVFGLQEITLKKSNFISRLPYIGREFDISFDVFPTWFNGGWHSVMHFTTSNRNAAIRGDRMPAIWFTRGNAALNQHKMLVCSDINGNKNYCYTTRNIIKAHKWTNIKITQLKAFGGYYFGITVDGTRIYTIRNDRAMSSKDMWLYAADPWYANQQGQIKNLIIKTSM